MKFVVPDRDAPLDEEWIEPLYAISEVVRQQPAYQFFEINDFMVMAKVIRSSRPHITEFKHAYTRRYLHLDGVGRAYRFIPPTGRGHGRFVDAPSLEWALDRVLLWELPWRKEELELYRFGLPYDERWRLQPRFDPRRFLIDEVNPPLYDDDWCEEPTRLRLVENSDAF